jgi:hypothetical protein
MAYWIVEDHGFCGQYYRCSNCSNVWIDTYEDIPEDTCPKCGVSINKDKTKYIDKPKKNKTKTNTETCRCLKTEDYKEYWGQWIECDCGFTSNVEHAKYCGGCGKEIEVVGVKPSEWEGLSI